MTEHVCVWAITNGEDGEPYIYCVHPGGHEKACMMSIEEAEARLNTTERFVAFMDEYYSIRGKIEPLKSDVEEDRILKSIYADILEGKDD